MTSVSSHTTRRHTQWTPQEIQRFFSRARRVYQSPSLDIRLAPQRYPDWGHLLIVTPRKMGNAPQRNLFKRRIKALYHEQALSNCGFDIAVFGKLGAADIPFSELVTILTSVCTKK